MATVANAAGSSASPEEFMMAQKFIDGPGEDGAPSAAAITRVLEKVFQAKKQEPQVEEEQ